MIQFNLLPDVKLQYVKARRMTRMVSLLSFVVGAASLFVLLLLLVTVDIAQKKSLHDLNGDITKYSKQINTIPDLSKILTVQNQLNTLTSLHDQKVVTSRLFSYIAQVTPNQTTLSSLAIDFNASSITMNGQAPSLDVINAFDDTLKSTTYTTDAAGSQPTKAFKQVVLAAFGRDASGATFTINLTFDPLIFNSANSVKLEVPAGPSGTSVLLFQKGSK